MDNWYVNDCIVTMRYMQKYEESNGRIILFVDNRRIFTNI